MMEIMLAFVTGLTTGGLSCLAVQGGLLTSSLANQIEKDVQSTARSAAGKKKKSGARVQPAQKRTQFLLPILAFLGAKLAAYTLLGFLLGWLGSMFQLSPVTRTILQIAIGIFMVGSGLRMLNVHPFFRHFVFEPPAFLRRKLRRTAAQGDALATPILLGLLTVLIPCGITQAMMAVALSTGSPFSGAALMFAFTLGTSPVFFAVAYFATQLGARVEKHFMRFVAVAMLLIGLYTIDTGLALSGSPLSLTRRLNDAQQAQSVERANQSGLLPAPRASSGQELQEFNPNASGPSAPGAVAVEDEYAGDESVVTIVVKNNGYQPSQVSAKAGIPIRLRLVSKDVYSCSLAFVLPTLNIMESLYPTGETWIDIPPQKKGTYMPFSCSMGMYTGMIVFDL
jgi:sulfite exporter TauE/SafE